MALGLVPLVLLRWPIGVLSLGDDEARAVGVAARPLRAFVIAGRPRQVAATRTLLERRGGFLLSHDGGVAESTTLLPGLVARADLVLVPVDCVSHDAAGQVKRCCRDLGKRFVPLRSASLASALSALETPR